MILSTFRSLKARRFVLLLCFFICNSTFLWRSQQRFISQEFVPGAPTPDGALYGYTPAQALEWYQRLNGSERKVVIQLGVLDIVGIIPSYTLFLGSQLVATNCPDVLCYLPLWTATFDLIESATHLVALASRHLAITDDHDYAPGDDDSSILHSQSLIVWTPGIFHLVVASAATQFKMAGLFLSLLLVLIYGIKAQFQSPQVKGKQS
jgi:hypothetical protein